MSLIPREEIEYEPEWNEETQIFEDVCPFQVNRRGNRHVCYCINKQNERVMFSNASQFKTHVLTQFHKIALNQYTTKKMISLKKELERSQREKASIHVSAEAEIARERRIQADLRAKLEKQQERYMADVIELNEKLIKVGTFLEKAEALLHIQGKEIEQYFLTK
jgi:hypothetical protein